MLRLEVDILVRPEVNKAQGWIKFTFSGDLVSSVILRCHVGCVCEYIPLKKESNNYPSYKDMLCCQLPISLIQMLFNLSDWFNSLSWGKIGERVKLPSRSLRTPFGLDGCGAVVWCSLVVRKLATTVAPPKEVGDTRGTVFIRGRSHLTEASGQAACERAGFLCELQAAYANPYPHGVRVSWYGFLKDSFEILPVSCLCTRSVPVGLMFCVNVPFAENRVVDRCFSKFCIFRVVVSGINVYVLIFVKVCPRSLSFVLVSKPNPRVVSFLTYGLLYGAKLIEHSRQDYTRVEITEFKHTERGEVRGTRSVNSLLARPRSFYPFLHVHVVIETGGGVEWPDAALDSALSDVWVLLLFADVLLFPRVSLVGEIGASDVVFDCCELAHIGGEWGGRRDCQVERALLLSQCWLWHDGGRKPCVATGDSKLVRHRERGVDAAKDHNEGLTLTAFLGPLVYHAKPHNSVVAAHHLQEQKRQQFPLQLHHEWEKFLIARWKRSPLFFSIPSMEANIDVGPLSVGIGSRQDFSKAYEIILRESMYKVLQEVKIPPKIGRIIRALTGTTKVKPSASQHLTIVLREGWVWMPALPTWAVMPMAAPREINIPYGDPDKPKGAKT
uniref:Uncharacterized protein n=1 Tax=Timema douglasi TaxID=61478 RepID=A0A7R8VEI7_TIMDO|nr:unnamed protein product [Timema douglasi]